MAGKKAKSGEVVAYKAFDRDLTWRGFQFEVGKSYSIKGDPVCCEHGFHACEHPFDVFNYYPFGSRIARVTLSGKLDRQEGDSKICGASIAKGNVATGDRGHAAATGYGGHAAATGEYGIAASLGPLGTATAGATGYIVLAHWNTGVWPYTLTRVERFKVGSDGVEAGKTYRLNKSGKPVEVK